MTAININHKNGIISTDDDSVITLGVKGAVKLGNGTYLDELGELQEIDPSQEYEGVIRYNSDRGCLQVCDGSQWKDVLGQYKQTSNIVWSLLF